MKPDICSLIYAQCLLIVQGRTVLHHMAQEGDEKFVKLLLETLAKFNSNSLVFNLEDNFRNMYSNKIDLFVDFEEIPEIEANLHHF